MFVQIVITSYSIHYTKLYELLSNRHNIEQFSNVKSAIILEMKQIEEYMKLELNNEDTLFLSDLSFPGLFTNILLHEPFPGKSFAYCHATSKNSYDYFQKSRNIKFKIESSFAKLFDTIFVGSYSYNFV